MLTHLVAADRRLSFWAAPAALLLLFMTVSHQAEAAPRFESTPVTTAFQGVEYTYEVVAEGIGEVTITAPQGLPNWLSLTRTGNGRYLLSGTPRGRNAGGSVVLRAQDEDPSWLCSVFPAACVATQSFDIEIISNRAPVVVAPGVPDQEAVEGRAFDLDISGHFEDPDGDPLTFSVTGLPASLGIDGAGTISGTPTTGDADASPFDVVVTADDGRGGQVADGFALQVRRLPRADLSVEPLAPSAPAVLLDESIEWEITVHNAGPDASGPVQLELELGGTEVTLANPPCPAAGAEEGWQRLTCDLDPLQADESASVRLRGSAESAGDVYLTAVASTPARSSIDANPDDNRAAGAVGVAESLARDPAQRLTATPAPAVAAGDLDGDGFDDLIVATASGEPVLLHLNVEDPGSLHEALKAPGDRRRGLSTVPMAFGVEAASADVLMRDLDGDGVPDAVLANGPGNAAWLFLGNDDGSLRAARSLGLEGVATRAVAAGDLTGNGLIDLVFANDDSVTLHANNGDGSFAAPEVVSRTQGRDGLAVAAADFTSNGLADVVLAEVAGPVLLYPNLGGGRFDTPIEIDPGPASSLSAADLTGDGLADLVVGRAVPGPSGLPSNTVYLNEGAAELRAAAELGAAETVRVLAADVTGNGALDIVTINAGGAHQVYAGDGQGELALHPHQFLYPDAAGAAPGRYARDGSLGLAVSGAGGTAVFFNDGAGALGLGMTERPVIELLGAPEVDLAVGDAYEDPGARATDAAGASLDLEVSNPVDTAVVGTYEVTYTAVDAAGNAADPAKRVVRVGARSETSGGGGGAAEALLIGLLLAGLLFRARVRARGRSRAPRS